MYLQSQGEREKLVIHKARGGGVALAFSYYYSIIED